MPDKTWFHLFMWNSHDAMGGLSDFQSVYKTLELAENAIPVTMDAHGYPFECAQIVTVDDAGQLRVAGDYFDHNYLKTIDGHPPRWIVGDSDPVRVLNA